LNLLLDNLIKSDQSDKAWEVFTTLWERNTVADSFTLSALVKGINQTNYKISLPWIIALIKETQSDPNFTPDEILYNVIIDACIKSRQYDQAIELFEYLKSPESKIKPDEITFNTLIKGYSLNKSMDKAF